MKLFGVSLGEGNTKVGEVFTFSLPSKITCPGASRWCRKNCYSYRLERIRPACRKAYANNLALIQDLEKFTTTMIGVLPRIMSCFRIHVGGDFMNPGYVRAWQRICAAFPQTWFWGYTRSWVAQELRAALDDLRSLPNVEVFASVDPNMTLPPKGWRVAFIDIDPRAKGIFCRHQTGFQESCLACEYCFRPRQGNVVFKTH